MKTSSVLEIVKLSPFLEEMRGSEDALRQSELRERVGKSKSTTHRAVKSLAEMGVVREEGAGYVLTEFGEVVAGMTYEYVSDLETADRYREFFGTIADTDLTLEDISGASVTRSSRDNPVAPLVRLAELTADAEDVRVLTNSMAPESFEIGRQGIRNGTKTVEMVIDIRTLESMRSNRWFGEELKKDLRTDGFDLWIHEDPVPHRIGVMDNKLCLGAEDEERMPVAMLETEDESAVEWAKNVIEEHREESDRLRPEEV